MLTRAREGRAGALRRSDPRRRPSFATVCCAFLAAPMIIALSACGFVQGINPPGADSGHRILKPQNLDARYFAVVAPQAVRRSLPLANPGVWLRLTTTAGTSFSGFIINATNCDSKGLFFLTVANNSAHSFDFHLTTFWNYASISSSIPWRASPPPDILLRPGQYVDIPLHLALSSPPGDLMFAALSGRTRTGVTAVYYCPSVTTPMPVASLANMAFGFDRYDMAVQHSQSGRRLLIAIDAKGNPGAYAVLALNGPVLVSSRILRTATGFLRVSIDVPALAAGDTTLWTLLVDSPESPPVESPDAVLAIHRSVAILSKQLDAVS